MDDYQAQIAALTAERDGHFVQREKDLQEYTRNVTTWTSRALRAEQERDALRARVARLQTDSTAAEATIQRIAFLLEGCQCDDGECFRCQAFEVARKHIDKEARDAE